MILKIVFIAASKMYSFVHFLFVTANQNVLKVLDLGLIYYIK